MTDLAPALAQIRYSIDSADASAEAYDRLAADAEEEAREHRTRATRQRDLAAAHRAILATVGGSDQ